MPIVVKGRLLIDGTGAPPIPNGAVLLDRDRISWVGPADALELPTGAEVIDCGNDTLLPGLVDAHTHASIIPALGDQIGQMRQAPVPKALRAVGNLRRDLRSGVTTARIMGEEHSLDVYLRAAIDAGQIVGPRLLISTRGIAASNGHGRAISSADGEAEVRKMARENLRQGADWLKLFVTGGMSSPDTSPYSYFYSRQEIQTAVEEAHRMDKGVAAHAHGGPGASMCIESGVDTIEHGALLNDGQLQLMIERGTWLVGTFSILFHPDGLERTDWTVPAIREKTLLARDAVTNSFGRVLSSGVKYTVGTDSMHGLLAYEMEMLVRLGASEMEAIQAATCRAAEACRVANRVGSLAAGRHADIISVRGNPLEDIEAMADVHLVMKGGQRYDS